MYPYNGTLKVVLDVRFFQNPSGDEPAREFLKALPKEDRAATGAIIRKLQTRTPCCAASRNHEEVRQDTKERLGSGSKEKENHRGIGMKKVKTAKHTPIGSSFNDWLDEELTDKEFRKLYETHLAKLDLGSKLKSIAKKKGLSVRGLAARMKTSPSQIQRMFSEDAAKCSIESLMKFALATGSSLPEMLGEKAA